MKLINIGFGNMINSSRLVAVVNPDSAPVKRLVQECKENGSLIDATQGRRTRAVLIMDSDHVVLSYLQAETVAHRLHGEDDGSVDLEEDENEQRAADSGFGSVGKR